MSEQVDENLVRASVLILAGGEGNRLGGTAKAFLEVDGTTLLERCVAQACRLVEEVVVGLPAAEVDRGKALVGESAIVVPGGETRQATFERVLAHVKHPIVVIHDVARPLASDELFRLVLEEVNLKGAVAPVLSLDERDSLALLDDGQIGDPVDRRRLVAIQTPYGFSRELLEEALGHARENGLVTSSVTTLVRESGHPVFVIAGEPENVKITYPADWDWVRSKISEADA